MAEVGSTDILSPTTTTVGGLCKAALRASGYLGLGMNPLAEDMNEAWASLQWMLQQWTEKRWKAYHNVTYVVTSTGKNTPYTVGPSGGPGGAPDFAIGTYPDTTRPNRIESAFMRQLINVPNGPVDFPLTLLQSMEDYNLIALKGLTNFALCAFYDPSYATTDFLGSLYSWPWPQATVYALGITVREPLPSVFPSLTSVVVLPPAYYLAIVMNLGLQLRPKYGLGSYPGDELPRQAKMAMNVLTSGNAQIANLQIPRQLSRGGIYDIFSDQTY